MATALSAQLAQIAAASKTTLNVKAQKAAHSKSLIFEPRVAAAQNYQTLFTICREGFDELCQLDPRYVAFGNSIFSPQSQDEDRTQMTAAENAVLDKRIDEFLRLVGSRLRLMPAIKALEWLVRRFRIHEYNTSTLISTFLPFHTIPAFKTLLSILPENLPQVYKFLAPYAKSSTDTPRSVLVHRAVHHSDFLAAVSSYTIETCRAQQQHPALISFWGGLMVEAVNGKLDRLRSGRRAIQADNDQSLLHELGPTISEALVMSKVPDLQIACYMVLAVFVAKGDLQDAAISALMEQLVSGWSTDSLRPGLVCLSILAQYRSAKQLSGRVTKALLKVHGLSDLLAEISTEHEIGKLSNGLSLALIDRLSKKGDFRGLPIIESLLTKHILHEQQAVVAFKSLLLAAHRVDDRVDEGGELRKALATTIVRLSQVDLDQGLFSKVIADTDVDIDALEMRLDTQIRPRAILAAKNDNETMDMGTDAPETSEDFSSAIERVGTLSNTGGSCLKPSPSDVFLDLCSVYLSSLSQEGSSPIFVQLGALKRNQAVEDSFYLTFFMRIWSGPYPTLARVGALDLVKARLKESDCQSVDFQAVIPHCISALNDPSKKVRRAAAELVIVLETIFAGTDKKAKTWGREQLYGTKDSLDWMEVDTARKLLQIILLPTLEECVLNAEQITAVIQSVLSSGSRQSVDNGDADKKAHVSHATRLSILQFLSSHAVHSPLMAVKLRLLAPLNQVKSVSGTTRTQLLLPLLKWWSSVSETTATQICVEQKVDERTVDIAFVDVILPNDKLGLEYLLGAVQSAGMEKREHLMRVMFQRLEKLWESMKSEPRYMVAQQMLNLANKGWAEERPLVATEAANLLRNVELTTDILLFFLESLQPAAKMVTEPPPGKRRRTSSSEAHRGIGTQTTPEITATLKHVTFVLQLVEGSEPEKHPQLLNPLFNALSELQHYRVIVGSELGYLQNLVLRSLLAIVPAYKESPSLKIDGSGGHGDLLVNCIQKSSSPAVQSSALLLIASLAKVAPDLVLHSVMPIFTFMGSSVLRQNDDYSAHVINQTVKEVVPPLIQSLRKGKRNPVAATSELLLSFVTAYEHIPSHRRLGLFVSLVETLGPEEFLFALLAMLADKYGATDQVLTFSTEVFNSFSVETQLQSLIKLLDLIRDVFQPKPALSSVLLGTNEESERDTQKIATCELSLLPQLLSSRKLISQISKLAGRDDMEASKVRELYSTLLEDLLGLANSLRKNKALYNQCSEGLSKLLNLLAIGEFIKAVETLLDRPDAALRRKVLRAVETRIDKENQSDASSRAALLAFLPQLTAIIRTSDDVAFKHIAVGCVDKIAEKYGKKDPEAVTGAANTIASDKCLGQDDENLRVMALLCLASLVDVLKDGIVPVLPSAIPKALAYMQQSVQAEDPRPELHNAGFAFMTALGQYLPYMLSGSYLKQLFTVASASANANLGSEANNARQQCLHFLAKQLEAKTLFTALGQTWTTATDSGFLAVREYLEILGLAIDKNTKGSIEKNASLLLSIIMDALDLRRIEYEKGDSGMKNVARIEAIVNEVSLKMIYKLNDAAFRPIFTQLMDWATTSLPKKNAVGRQLRLLSVFGFLHHFFDNLKSIVTSYGTYVVDAAVNILNTANVKKAEDRELWKKVLQTLASCFEHDQDDFWQAPTHFNAVAPVLTAQFAHAGTTDLTLDLVPAIVELANAADSQDHQKELNGALLKHLRSEQTAVRLAAVKCEQEITNRLGEEWLSMLPEMLPYISELQEDDDEDVERETHRWIVGIEGALGESLDAMLQ
ncbi:U3 small nucleolar RNA-associated protein [Microdochium trichocladiopsis]|uniref:U3 small nucleolar RNA-associated protein 10 n=1 Tax=Microdochium trichocladiopsis TaxID=1682393 RepID=A0A9P9BV62_9PEZI|nr:U3 small nucleolar RNA-associated protein [Microdochium trichocladiopsis]KAH7038159.1 U3 small nucleolar RNA-associated protein [Microdochium trichocladiopsis]